MPEIFHTQDDLERMIRGEAPLPGAAEQVYGGGQTPTPGQDVPRQGGAELVAGTSPTVHQTTPPTSQSQAASPTTLGAQTPGQASQYGQFMNLFGTGLGRIQTAQGELGKAREGFMGQAGTSRSFSGIGGADILSKGISQTGAPREAAKDLVNAQYTGPQGLSQEALQKVIAQMTSLEGINPTKGAGTGFLLQQANPGLTSGEARFESQRLLQDPGYQGASQQFLRDMGTLQRNLAQEQTQASAYAQGRAQEESDIARQSKEYLETAYGNVANPLLAQAEEKNRLQGDITTAAKKVWESGNLSDLSAIPKEALGFDPEAFNTKHVKRAAKAKATWRDIMADYSKIKDIPMLDLGVDAHGRPELRMSEKWVNENKNLSRDEIIRAANAALKRHAALSEAGFLPMTHGGGTWQWPKVRITGEGQDWYAPSDVPEMAATEGKYAQYKPLYGGEWWKPEDFRPFLTGKNFQARASLENLASDEQVAQLNAINEILGRAERIPDDVEPFQTAMVMANVDRYLKKQEKDLKARRGSLSTGESEFLAALRSTRKKYKKQARAKTWGKIAGFASNITPLGWTASIAGGISGKDPWTHQAGEDVIGEPFVNLFGA